MKDRVGGGARFDVNLSGGGRFIDVGLFILPKLDMAAQGETGRGWYNTYARGQYKGPLTYGRQLFAKNENGRRTRNGHHTAKLMSL